MSRQPTLITGGPGFIGSHLADVTAVQVITRERPTDDLRARWRSLFIESASAPHSSLPQLVVPHSEYRDVYGPLALYLQELEQREPQRSIAVVLPQLVEARWY